MRGGPVVGILLAAGDATRFGADKLAAPLADGTPLGIAALRNLIAAVDAVVAVVRPADVAAAAALAAQGARVTACPDATAGMGASLAWGVRAAPAASGWVIALADMPWVRSQTIAAIVAELRAGAPIAAPECRGRRGHPVGFAASYYPQLSALSGDEGAKRLLAGHSVALVATDDEGVLRDVDTRADLAL
jgi:molybdenum cofactor cytidylyltransferase